MDKAFKVVDKDKQEVGIIDLKWHNKILILGF